MKDYKIKCVDMYTNTYEHKCINETKMLSIVCFAGLGHVLVCDAKLWKQSYLSIHDVFETIPSSINQYTAAHGRLWPCVAVADPGKTLQDCGWTGPCDFSRREPWWLSAGSFGLGDREWLLSFIHDEPKHPMGPMAAMAQWPKHCKTHNET